MLDGAVDATETLAFSVFFFPGDPIVLLSANYLSVGSPRPFDPRSVFTRYLFMLLLPRLVLMTFLSFST